MKVALIVSNTANLSPLASAWRTALVDAGHTADPRLPTTGGLLTGGYDAAVFTGVDAAGLPGNLDTWAVPMVASAGRDASTVWRALRICDSIGGTSSTTIWTPQTVGATLTPLLAGLSADFAPWASGITKHTATAVAGSTALAVVNSGSHRVCYWHTPAGATLSGGGTAPAARVGLAMDDQATPSASLLSIIAALVSWMDGAAGPAPVAEHAPLVRATHAPPAVLSNASGNADPDKGPVVTLTGETLVLPGSPAVSSVLWTPITAGAPAVADPAALSTTVDVGALAAGAYVYQLEATSSAGTRSCRVELVVTDNPHPMQWWDDTAGVLKPRRRLVYRAGPPATWLNIATGALEGSPLGGPPPATSVGLVVADDGLDTGTAAPNNADLWIKTRLEAAGYAVTYVADKLPTSTLFDCLFVSPTANATDAGNAWRTFDGPMVVSNGASWDDHDLGPTGGTTASVTTLDVVSAGHPIAAGLTGTVALFTAATGVRSSTGVLGTAVWDLAATGGATVISAFEVGDLDDNGAPVAHRKVALGFDAAVYNSSGSPRFTDPDGFAVFDAVIAWCYPAA